MSDYLQAKGHPMPTRTPTKKSASRVLAKAPVVLVVLEGGKVKDVVYHNTSGHAFIADIDALKALTPVQREAAILLGAPSRILGHRDFEEVLEGIVNPPPVEAPSVPVEAPVEVAPVVPAAPVAEPVTEPTPAPVEVPDPTVVKAAALNEVLTPGTVANETLAAGQVPAPVVVEPEPTGPLPNPAASAGPPVVGPETVAGPTASVQV